MRVSAVIGRSALADYALTRDFPGSRKMPIDSFAIDESVYAQTLSHVVSCSFPAR